MGSSGGSGVFEKWVRVSLVLKYKVFVIFFSS